MTFCISLVICCRLSLHIFFWFFYDRMCVNILSNPNHPTAILCTYLLLTGLLNRDDATACMPWISVIGPSLFRCANTFGMLKYAYVRTSFDAFWCFTTGNSLDGCRYTPVGTVQTNRGRFGIWSSTPLLLCVASIHNLRRHRSHDIEMEWKNTLT